MASPSELLPTAETADDLTESERARWRPAASWREFGIAVAIVGFATLIALALRPYLAATNLAMVYLLGVVVVATRCNRAGATATLPGFTALLICSV